MDNKTVIIIDDERVLAIALKRILECHFPGINVCCVIDPKKQSFKAMVALLLKTTKVDLIITDVELRYTLEVSTEDGRVLNTSRMELGYEIITDLVDQVPCIVMSASEQALDFQGPLARFAYLRPRIKAFFPKPLPQTEALVTVVRNALFPLESPPVNPQP